MIVNGDRKLAATAAPKEDGKYNKRSGPKKKKKVVRRDYYHKGKWSDEEKLLFLVGLRRFGKGKWKQIGKVLTTRNPIQIKSHGQKLVGKWEAGENIFVELNNYESMMGSEVQVVSSSETESDDDDFVVEDAPGLIHDASMDEDEPLIDWMTPSSEPLPTAASLCYLFTPTPKMQVTVKSNLSVVNFQENEMPLLHRHFGSAKPISFVSSVEEERRATFFKSTASAFRRGDDVLAAMLLCQLASAKNASREALLAPRPAFSSSVESNAFDCSLPRQSNFPFEPIPILSTTSEMEQDNESLLACYQFEPIPISSITSEMEQDNESLLACYPLILEEQTSNVISPTAFAEV